MLKETFPDSAHSVYVQKRVQNPPFTHPALPFRTFPAVLIVWTLLWVLRPGAAQALSLTVRIQGLDSQMQQAALSGLTLEKQKNHDYLNDSLIRRLNDQAPEEIMRALEPLGFYGARVESHLKVEGDTYDALYIVTPGIPVTVTDLDIRFTGEGSKASELLKQRREFPLVKGDTFVHSVYEQGKKALIFTAFRVGYLDARYVENRVIVRKEDASAQIVLHLETGPRFTLSPPLPHWRRDFPRGFSLSPMRPGGSTCRTSGLPRPT